MSTILRWGILGTGNIARQFVQGLGVVGRRHRVAAVGSRKAETAGSFAAAHKITNAYVGYDAVLKDPQVDAVYNALPNSLHQEWSIKALRAGKHVLCEKPIATTTAQAREMFEAAEQSGRRLMEAFMYRSHPLTHAVRDAVARGEIGEIKMIRTSFSYKAAKIEGNVRFDASLAGGSLMDIGCYCVNFSRFFAGGEPKCIKAVGELHASGVDEYASAVLKFANGIEASFLCGMGAWADNTAHLLGTQGHIQVPIPWKPPLTGASYVITDAGGQKDVRTVLSPYPEVMAITAVYALEADEFRESILTGGPLRISKEDSLGNMRVLDVLRREIGLKF